MNSQHAVDLNPPSDAELIAAVRGGDSAAYGQLFERHRDAATRLARQIAGPSDADDLVSDAFIKVLGVLSAGGGPDLAFRAYLLTAVRRLHVDRIRRSAKVTPSDEIESFDPGVPFSDPAVKEFENVAASKAFASLPERWQLVLWHIEVEGQKPAEVAPLLGMSANSVSALAYRAREGLRQAYLQMHMADTASEECRWVTERLGARVRNGLSRRDTVKVDEHLDDCARCAAVYLELSEVNSNLAGILAPLLLGGAASGYLASVGSGSLAAAPWLWQARHFVKGHVAISAGSTAATAVAAAVAIAAITHGPPPQDTASERNDLNSRIATSPSPTQAGSTQDPSSKPPRVTRPGGPTNNHEPANKHHPRNTPTSTAPGDPSTAPGSTTAPGGDPGRTQPDTTQPGDPSNNQPGLPAQPDQHNNPPSHPHPTHTTEPPPTTTTPPPPPPGLDLQLGMATTALHAGRYRAAISVEAPAKAEDITVTMALGGRVQDLVFTGAGWTCGPEFTKFVRTYTCVADDSSPLTLVALVKYHPRGAGRSLTATVSAPGNDDPISGNNSASIAT